MKTNITSKTKPSKSAYPYVDGSNDGYNYLWRLVNLSAVIPAFARMTLLKDGFAQRTYSDGTHGVESRVKNTLADIERKMGIERGTLKAQIIWAKEGTYDATLSAEQFFHTSNKDYKIQSMLHGFTNGVTLGQEWDWKAGKTIGGASEFYNMPVKTAKAKFANAWRKANRAIGFKTVQWKRANGIFGCPIGGLTKANGGGGDEEPSL
jgi:hypothetical protein